MPLGEGDGFVIIKAAADQGLLDIHDRKPPVLTAELAWGGIQWASR